jgi:3-deoxy-manno-octulosonate cytidylyltransferase (CMP-KDO synthetase)
MATVGIIAARLQSSRFPNKVLQQFNGKRIIDHVIENVRKMEFIDDIVIASDDEDFAKSLCKQYSFLSFHISHDVVCGSHRSYKYYLDNPDYDYYVSIPADEPAINPDEVNKALNSKTILYSDEIVTLYTKFYCYSDLISNLSCKIVTCANNYMIYNSRNVVPVNKDGSHLELEQYKKHVGIFVFPRQVFDKYGDLWKNTISIESLEQNRFLQKSLNVKLLEISHIGFGIDVFEQIKKLENRVG